MINNLKYDTQDVEVFGDDYNDIDMFSDHYYGNACDVKKVHLELLKVR